MGQSSDEASWLSVEAPVLLVGYNAVAGAERKAKLDVFNIE